MVGSLDFAFALLFLCCSDEIQSSIDGFSSKN